MPALVLLIAVTLGAFGLLGILIANRLASIGLARGRALGALASMFAATAPNEIVRWTGSVLLLAYVLVCLFVPDDMIA